MDTAFIERCADPVLTAAIVEYFVASAGSDDPLAVTVKVEGRRITVPRPTTPAQARLLVNQYAGSAEVRIGITQWPIRPIGPQTRASEDVFDPCQNLRMGTALFSKVARIVTRWYGNPTDTEVLAPMVEDAIHAWKTGFFEGTSVFTAPDPGGRTFFDVPSQAGHQAPADANPPPVSRKDAMPDDQNLPDGPIRIDLSRINGRD